MSVALADGLLAQLEASLSRERVLRETLCMIADGAARPDRHGYRIAYLTSVSLAGKALRIADAAKPSPLPTERD